MVETSSRAGGDLAASSTTAEREPRDEGGAARGRHGGRARSGAAAQQLATERIEQRASPQPQRRRAARARIGQRGGALSRSQRRAASRRLRGLAGALPPARARLSRVG